jgi:hypothetical protein
MGHTYIDKSSGGTAMEKISAPFPYRRVAVIGCPGGGIIG